VQGRAHIEQKSAAGSIQRVSGFKGLSYKPLDKQVALAKPELKNEGDACKKTPPPVGWRNLEVEAQAELHAARIVGTVQVKETCTRESARRNLRRHAVVDAIELGVIEDVERFPPEFKPSSFVN
jgi:hypothetical protein